MPNVYFFINEAGQLQNSNDIPDVQNNFQKFTIEKAGVSSDLLGLHSAFLDT